MWGGELTWTKSTWLMGVKVVSGESRTGRKSWAKEEASIKEVQSSKVMWTFIAGVLVSVSRAVRAGVFCFRF